MRATRAIAVVVAVLGVTVAAALAFWASASSGSASSAERAVRIAAAAGAGGMDASEAAEAGVAFVLVDADGATPSHSTPDGVLAGLPEGLLAEAVRGPATSGGWAAAPTTPTDGETGVMVAVARPADGEGAWSWSRGGLALLCVLAAAGLGALAAAAAGLGALATAWSPRRESPSASQARSESVPPPTPAVEPAEPVAVSAPSRHEVEHPPVDLLVDQVIEVRDLLQGSALTDRLAAGLAAVGYQSVDPVGQPFDPEAHQAVDVAETDDSSLHGTIASTERVGYLVNGQPVRRPDVVVYRGSS